MYKQSVETTDTFLGMSGKDPSSTQCEDLLVKISLPGASGAAGIQYTVCQHGTHAMYAVLYALSFATGRSAKMAL